MKRITASLTLLITFLFSGFSHAHHSFSATFTDERKSTIQGVVADFSFRNPHVLIYVEVTNEDGSTTEWISEGSSATSMRSRGWSADTLQEGQMVRISGDATHDGTPMTSIDYVEILDPSSLAVVSRLGEGNASGNAYQPEIADSLPLTLTDGRPNLSSAWSNRTTRNTRPGQFESVSLNSTGQALQDIFNIANDAQVFCDPVGLVRQTVTPHPLRISQFEDHVVLEYEEFGGYRKVYFDDREVKGIHTHYGDSIARYEGDKLIIETSNLLTNQATNQGYRLTNDAIVTEVYSRSDSDQGTQLLLQMTIEDPAHLAEDLVYNMLYADQGNYEFIENDCQPPLRQRTEVHAEMNFFLTSNGSGDGANLGGLEGADAHCLALATNVGQGDKNWVAYLSTTGANGVNARDRIAGAGPFYNASGVPVAVNVDDLHSDTNTLVKTTSLNEFGNIVNGRGDSPNRHDVLTGSDLQGMAVNDDSDTTCNNWTSNSEGAALVGHFDREGGGDNPTSWNSAHPSRGCSPADLQRSGGDGLFYCFATP